MGVFTPLVRVFGPYEQTWQTHSLVQFGFKQAKRVNKSHVGAVIPFIGRSEITLVKSHHLQPSVKTFEHFNSKPLSLFAALSNN